MAEPQSENAALTAALALVRALASEIKNAAHDPATVHLVAEKLHHGIDAIEKALTDQPKPPGDQPQPTRR